MDMGAIGKYRMYGQGDKTYGGMFDKTADMPMPPMWIYYVHVDDLDAAIARATGKGAKLLIGPMPSPAGGSFSSSIRRARCSRSTGRPPPRRRRLLGP